MDAERVDNIGMRCPRTAQGVDEAFPGPKPDGRPSRRAGPLAKKRPLGEGREKTSVPGRARMFPQMAEAPSLLVNGLQMDGLWPPTGEGEQRETERKRRRPCGDRYAVAVGHDAHVR